MFSKIFSLIIGYCSLFAVVWLHEVGHAMGYAFYGCKEHVLHVTVKPYIFFSTPAPINQERANTLSDKQVVLISYGGVVANFFWALISMMLISLLHTPNIYLQLFLWLILTLNLAEIISYMVFGNIYLVSDMAIIASIFPKLRILNFVVGCLLFVLYLLAMIRIPDSIDRIVLIWNISTILGMCGGRVVFAAVNARKLR